MTHLQTLTLTAAGRSTAQANDLRWRFEKVLALYNAAQPGSAERKALGVVGRKLYAELNGGR